MHLQLGTDADCLVALPWQALLSVRIHILRMPLITLKPYLLLVPEAFPSPLLRGSIMDWRTGVCSELLSGKRGQDDLEAIHNLLGLY